MRQACLSAASDATFEGVPCHVISCERGKQRATWCTQAIKFRRKSMRCMRQYREERRFKRNSSSPRSQSPRAHIRQEPSVLSSLSCPSCLSLVFCSQSRFDLSNYNTSSSHLPLSPLGNSQVVTKTPCVLDSCDRASIVQTWQ